MQLTINQSVSIPFTSIGLATGLTVFTPAFLLNGSPMVASPLVYAEIGGGLYTITFTPVVSGSMSLFIEHTLLTDMEVVNRTNTVILQNLEDEALGSWIWDKTKGILNLVRQDGTTLANFNVVDNLTTASRERF